MVMIIAAASYVNLTRTCGLDLTQNHGLISQPRDVFRLSNCTTFRNLGPLIIPFARKIIKLIVGRIKLPAPKLLNGGFLRLMPANFKHIARGLKLHSHRELSNVILKIIVFHLCVDR